MWTWPGRSRLAAALTLALAISGAVERPEATVASATAAQDEAENPWPTTDFEIYFVDSGADTPGDVSELVTPWRRASSPNEQLWADRISDYLTDAAQKYEKERFREPSLGSAVLGGYRIFVTLERPTVARPLVSALFSKLYVVNRENLRVESGADYIVLSKGWFDVEASGSAAPPADMAPPAVGSEWDVFLYTTLAHELFHAVAERYARDGGYAPYTAWESQTRLDRSSVDEALADGMARWARDQKFPGWADTMPVTNKLSVKHVGMYAYHHGFLFRSPTTYPAANAGILGYRASSFWLNLVERWGSGVIRHLLALKIPESMTTADLVTWLDEGLKDPKWEREGLYVAYNHFLAEMAAYGEVPRYQAFAGAAFFNPVFGNPCAVTITLAPGSSAAGTSQPFDLPRMGATCVRIAWQNYTPANFAAKDLEVSVSHAGNNRAILDQINLGIAAVDLPGLGGVIPGVPPEPFEITCWKGRVRYGRSCANEKPTQPTNSATAARVWSYDNRYVATEQGEALFVLTNVAVDAATTVDAPGLTVSFSLRATQSHTGPRRSPSVSQPMQLAMPTRPDYMRLRMYGVNPDPPLEQTIGGNPFATTFAPIAIPKGVGELMDVGYYLVTPDPGRPIAFGSTGPLYGAVIDMSFATGLQGLMGRREVNLPPSLPFLRVNPRAVAEPAPPAQLRELLEGLEKQVAGTAGSMMCQSNEGRPIGHVEAYNDELLLVRIDTDICAGVLTGGRLVERLDVTAILPFGWRYQSPAPTQDITPALEFFVNRFHDRLEGRLNRLWMGAPPDLDAALAATTPPPAAGGNSTGATITAPAGPRPCDCSCDGFKAFEELSKRRDEGARAEMTAAMPCMKQCMVRWASCAR